MGLTREPEFGITGGMARIEGACWKCGTAWAGDSQPGRSDCCPKCDFDLHSCRNCKHHDPRYRNECRIPESDRIQDRDRANFCEYFEIGSYSQSGSSPADEARRKLENLFGGG